MKKRLMMIAAIVLVICNIVKAEDIVTISDFRISVGETKEVSISLENETEYVAFQFDIYLPEGITVESFSADRNRMPESTTLDMYQQMDGAYRFISAAVGGKPMTGNSGSIVTLTVKASESLAYGEYYGYFDKIKLSKADATGPTYGWMSFLVIVEEPSVVTVTSCSREYGEDNPMFEYTVTGGSLESEPIIACEATAKSPVGTYPITIAKGNITNSNVTFVDGTLTITKAPLKIIAGEYTRKQGEDNPEFTLTYEGFKNNETEAVLTKKPTVATTATKESAVDDYTVTVSGAEAQNYEITYVNGTLKVTDADPVVVTANSYTRVYGDDNPTFEYTSSGAELVGIPEITCEATATSPVGTYDIIIKKGSVTNYNDSYEKGTLTITKAPLKIKASIYTRKEGEDNPEFALKYEGFKNNETETVLTKQPEVTCEATKDSPAGEYTVTVSGAEAQNYEISYENGKLIIGAVVEVLEEISFSEAVDEETDLSNVVIDNTYYTMDADNGDGYDAEEQAIVLNSTVTEEQMDAVQDAEVGDETVRENYFGIIFEVPAGNGIITVDVKTIGTHVLNVQIGDGEPTKVTMSERGTVDVEYSVKEPTYVYLYASSNESNAARAHRAPIASENSVLLYGYKVTSIGKVIKKGDVNIDDKVNGTDIQAVINVIVDEDYVEEADINKDNKVNGTDIQEIINIIVEEE
jgi:hypothetical protein